MGLGDIRRGGDQGLVDREGKVASIQGPVVPGAAKSIKEAEVAGQSFLMGNPSRWSAGLALRAHGAKGGAAIRREKERERVKCPQGQCGSELRRPGGTLDALGFTPRVLSTSHQLRRAKFE